MSDAGCRPRGGQVIRRIRLAHCKRGPARCQQCRELDVERICLLELFPPLSGEEQRRLIALEVDGREVWWGFEIVQVFANAEEARAFAAQHGIQWVEV